MKKSTLQNLSLFTVALGLMSYELGIARVFSMTSWSTFGSMVISIAMLGFGMAGTLLTFMQEKVKKNPDLWLSIPALALAPVMALSYILAQYVPFNPVFFASQPVQLWYLAAYYIIYAMPFFVGAVFIGVAFVVISARIHKLYFWDMLGSGTGGLILLGLMYLMPASNLIFPMILITFAGSLLTVFNFENKKIEFNIRPIFPAIAVGLMIVAVTGVVFFGDLQVNKYKGTSQAKVTFKDLKARHYEYSPLGEMEIYESSAFHFAPGLSDVASLDSELVMPQKAYWALYINGDGPISIMRQLSVAESRYMEYLPMTAPYTILKNPNVMLIKLGGGFTVFTALYNNAQKITVVEPNVAIVDMMRDVPALKYFNGDLLHNPKVKVIVNEPRAFAESTQEKFDLVEISLIDSVGLSQSVGNSLDENYIYTVEGFVDYLNTLSDNGILSITGWNHLSPPRNIPKVMTTVVAALKKQKVTDPSKRIFSFGMIYSTVTVLVKNSDFTQDEIGVLRKFCRLKGFDEIYFPGYVKDVPEFNAMADSYMDKYLRKVGENVNTENTNLRDPASLYYHVIKLCLEGKEKELYAKYIFNIAPSTDDKPYFSAYIKPSTIVPFLTKLDSISEEWGYLVILGTLLQALIFGVLIILIPVIGSRKTGLKNYKGLGGIVLYYASLGIAYMLVEIYLIQKLVFFLADPIFSISIVIMSMLIISGLGSLFASSWKIENRKKVLIAGSAVAVTLLLYIFALPPVLKSLLGLPLIVKALLAAVFIAPAAFFMGMPFPTGLSELSRSKPGLYAWAWGTNGALSVSGSLLARVISIHVGFAFVLVFAAILYATVALIFPVNQNKSA